MRRPGLWQGVVTVWYLLLPWGAVACIVIPPVPPRPEIRPLYLDCKSQHIVAEITDQVARVTVTTELYNPHSQAIEGTFLFPVPAGASVSRFSYWIGDKEIQGELLDREKARRLYEEIVRRLRDPALLEYEGSGVFQARVFPVAPRGTVRTRLEYVQLLPAQSELIRFRHPVKLGRTTPNRGELVVEVRLRSQRPIKAVYSPSHQIEVTRPSDREARASLELSDTDFGTDFELLYSLSEREFGLNALMHRPRPEEAGFFMLLLAPKREWGEEEIEGKDVVFVLDTSGSMRGKKIEQAKQAFQYCLEALRPKDRFGLLAFATETRRYAETLKPAEKEEIAKAKAFVAQLEAVGATALNEALIQAVSLFEQEGSRPRMIVFLTDGLPTVGERNIEQILKNVAKANGATEENTHGRRARLFIFGVGEDVNTHLLDRLAEENGGISHYVRPEEDIEAAISTLYAQLSHPVLSNVRLEIGNVEARQLYPQRLPDLFVGSQLIITGRYEGSGRAKIVLKGEGRGEERTYEYETEFPERTEENAFVARLWATRRIGYLLDQIRLHGEEKELKEEIVELALRYGIVTPYTSYFVQEEKALPAGTEAQRRAFMDASAAAGGGAFGPSVPAPVELGKALQEAVGGGAVRAAQSTQALKYAATPEARYTTYQQVGSRTFYREGEYWTEVGWQREGRIIRLKAFSEAYFELLRLRPDWAAYLALGANVRLREGTLRVEIGPEGQERLTDEEREALRAN